MRKIQTFFDRFATTHWTIILRNEKINKIIGFLFIEQNMSDKVTKFFEVLSEEKLCPTKILS